MSSYGNILVIDDEIILTSLLRDFLSAEGYVVTVINNPHLGLSIVKEKEFDLVITDLMMPGISGMDIIKTIRTYDTDTPIIMMTAYNSVETAVLAMKEGTSDFITKPFNLDHASLLVKRAIEGGHARKQSMESSHKSREAHQLEFISRNLQEKVMELSALYAMSEALHRPLNTPELFEKMIEIAISVTEAERGAVLMMDRDKGYIAVKAARGVEKFGRTNIPVQESGLIGSVFAEKSCRTSENYTSCICGGSRTNFNHPFLGVPIVAGNEVFAVLHLCQKIGGSAFTSNDIALISNLAEKASVKIENIALYENLIQNTIYSVTSLIRAIDARDNYTMNHCKRVTSYAVQLSQYLGCPDEIADALRLAGPVHDVGKIGIRDNILLKPGRLEADEIHIMNSHVVIGDDIIKPINVGPLEHAVVQRHHERFDGTGYPDGLKGKDIPLIARIFSVADTYDAMTTTRPYRSARPHEEAVAELLKCRGGQLDGDIVDVFLKQNICKREAA